MLDFVMLLFAFDFSMGVSLLTLLSPLITELSQLHTVLSSIPSPPGIMLLVPHFQVFFLVALLSIKPYC